MKSIKILHILGCALLAFGISACGDSSDSSSDEIIVQKDINGLSQKGPFIKGSAVHLYELDPVNLNQTGNIFTGKINSDEGDFIIKGINLKSSYALFETSGYYRNEVTGKKSSGTLTLNAISDLSDRNQVNINLLTHLEFERVRHLVGGDVSIYEAKDQAESEIIASFGGNKASSNFEDLNIFEKNDENAMLLAISILLQGDRSEAELSDLLADYASDIEKDGKWDNEKAKKEIATWALNKIGNEELAVFRKNIESWKYGSVPNFEKYIVNYVNFIFGCNKKSIGDTLELESGFIFRCAENKDGSFYYESLKSGLNSKTPWTAKAGASFPVVIGDKKFTGFWSYHNNPSSKFIWPAPIGKGIDSLQGVIDACGGVCGKGKFGISEDVYMGMTLNFSNEEKEQPVDISSWQGICVESEGIINIELKPSDEENFTWYGNYYYRVTNKGIIDIPWEYFTQPSWFGKKVDLEESLKRTVAFKLRFELSDGDPDFSLKAIGPMGTCGKSTVKPIKPESRPGYDDPGYEYPDYQEVIGPEFNTEHLWSAADGVGAFDITVENEDYAAHWYYFSDEEIGGASTFTWPAEPQNSLNTLQPVIDACDGSVCGSAVSYDYIGVGLDFCQNREKCPFDITNWGGICVESEGVIGVEIVPSNEREYTEFDNYRYYVTENGIIDIPWKFFEQSGWGRSVPLEDVLKRTVGIVIRLDREYGAKTDFKIKAVGPLGTCGTPTVEAKDPSDGKDDCSDCIEIKPAPNPLEDKYCEEGSIVTVDGYGTFGCEYGTWYAYDQCPNNFDKLELNRFWGTEEFTCYEGEWYISQYFPFTKERDEYLNLDRSAYGTFVDSRNGVSYATYDIGPFKWMAQNLNYTDSTKTPYLKGNVNCAKGSEVYCIFEGARYTWTAAMNIPSEYQDKSIGSMERHYQGICPDGWWLPDTLDYLVLNYLDNYALSINNQVWFSDETYKMEPSLSGAKYSFSREGYWKDDHLHVRCVTNSKPCNKSNEGEFETIDDEDDVYVTCENGSWYVASKLQREVHGRKCTQNFEVITGYIDGSEKYVCYEGTWYNTQEFPVTQEWDTYLSSSKKYTYITDSRDGKKYATVDVGPYTWFAQNLNYTDSSTTPNLKGNVRCFYDNPVNCELGGALYTWTAAMDYQKKFLEMSASNLMTQEHYQGVCPEGWRLPETKDTELLYQSSGGELEALLSEKTNMKISNVVTNSSGMSLTDVGFLYDDGAFVIRDEAGFWLAEEDPQPQRMKNEANRWFVTTYSVNMFSWNKKSGNPVRCVKLNTECNSENEGKSIDNFVCHEGQWTIN